MQDDDDSNGSFVPAPSKDLELDPFGYPVKKIWTPYEVVKTVLMTLLLVPVLRLLLFYICLYMASRVAKRAISDLNDRTDGDGNIVPLPAERQRILKELSFWSRVGLWLYGFYKIEIKGKLDPKAKVLVSNHSSMIDGLFIFAQVIPSVVAKDDVADMFLFGNILKCIQAIFVDRSDKDAKLSVLNEMKRRVSKPGFPPILIFPEGTTTNQSTLISFKRGAFSLGVPVQPIILDFRRNKNYNLSWVPGGPSTPIHLYHTLCQFQNYVTLTFLPLHIPTDEELSNPSIYSENVRSAMASVMRVPTTSHSLEDSMLFLHSTKKKGVQVNVIIQELRSKFKIRTIQELKDALSAFHEMDSNHDGWIDYSEFCRAFKIQDSEKAQILFDLLDSTGNGAIDFREFVFALYAITQDSKELPQTKRQNLIKAFLDVLEIEGDGLLSEDDAKIILKGTSSGLTITEVENRILSMVKETKGYTGLPSRKVSFTDLVQLTQKHEGKLDRLPKTLRAVLQRHVDMKLNKQLASSI